MTYSFKQVLPEFPSMQHLPWKPNSKGDHIASEQEASIIFSSEVVVQEKIDGASCGMAWIDGYPVVRSRSKILRKGQQLKNPSLAQFASAWNWMHGHELNFARIESFGPYSVYGEWMVQQHGMYYDNLPSKFIAYELYDYEKQQFVASELAIKMLKEAEFYTPQILFSGTLENYEQVELLANSRSAFSTTELIEGVVVKISDDQWLTNIFKMVRQGFNQGCLLGDKIKRNLIKS